MDVKQAQQATSFQLSRLTTPIVAAELMPTLDSNQKVDLVLADKTGNYLLSGDKVSLSEVGKAAPEISLALSNFDRDGDGFLVESELKLSPAEVEARDKKYQDLKQQLDKRKRNARRQHNGTGSTYALAADLTALLCKPSDSLYRTPDWNSKEPIQDERKITYCSASSLGASQGLVHQSKLTGFVDLPAKSGAVLKYIR